MADACPICGDRLNHAGLPSAMARCADRAFIISALKEYAEKIDETAYGRTVFADLLGGIERRCDGDLSKAAQVCETVIGLGWRPAKGGAS